MADRSAIEWTDATWNPVTGCTKVSPGCANCYAETMSLRFGWSQKPWVPEHEAENVVLHPERLDQPLRWRKPRMVFTCSMSDLFHERVPFEYIAEVFDVMVSESGERHIYQVLTKRPERAREFFSWLDEETSWPLLGDALRVALEFWSPPHIWIGVSIENTRFTWRADVLREIPAAVRFVSAEPLLGSLYAKGAHDGRGSRGSARPAREGIGANQGDRPDLGDPARGRSPLNLSGIDWLIVGGESGGRQARAMHPDWACELRDACLAACPLCESGDYCETCASEGRRPAFFFKQWGSHDARGVYRGASPKSGGRLLDGRKWNEMPGVGVPACSI